VCSIVLAIGLVRLKKPHLKWVMLEWCESLSEIMFRVTEIVLCAAPFGIGGYMAAAVGQSGIGILVALGELIGSLYATLAVFILVFRARHRVGPIRNRPGPASAEPYW